MTKVTKHTVSDGICSCPFRPKISILELDEKSVPIRGCSLACVSALSRPQGL